MVEWFGHMHRLMLSDTPTPIIEAAIDEIATFFTQNLTVNSLEDSDKYVEDVGGFWSTASDIVSILDSLIKVATRLGAPEAGGWTARRESMRRLETILATERDRLFDKYM
jgi:hypothetical protein